MPACCQIARCSESVRSDALPMTYPRAFTSATWAKVMGPGGSPASSVPSMSKLTRISLAAGSAIARVRQRQHPVDGRTDPGLLAEPGQPAQLIAGPHGGAGHRQLGEEDPGQ